MKYDIIGDVHGRATKLKELLSQLGYQQDLTQNWFHPGRKAIFVGDIINKGGEIFETVRIVRGMVESGYAEMVIGNHEWNWILGNSDTYRSTTNAYLDRPQDYESDLNWVKTLPYSYENDHFRVVHAYWDAANIRVLSEMSHDHENLWEVDKFRDAIAMCVNGPYYFPDELERPIHQDISIDQIRLRWWQLNISLYGQSEKPLFFGHYCIEGDLVIYQGNICCLDPCAHRTNRLAAYCWKGEEKLLNQHLVII